MHKYMEEDDEYDLKELPTIEMLVDNKTNVLAVKKQVLEESMIEIPLKELVVYNVAKGQTVEKLKDHDFIRDIE